MHQQAGSPSPVEAATGLKQIDDVLGLLAADRAETAAADESILAALFDLTQRVLRGASLGTACRIAADGVKQIVRAEAVAISLVRRGSCRLEAVAGVDSINRHSELAARYEAACRRAMIEYERTGEKSPARQDGYLLLPCRHGDGRLAAICLLDESTNVSPQLLPILSETIGLSLGTRVASLQSTSWSRRWDWFAGRFKKSPRAVGIVALALVVVALLPVPYQVHCDCELQPTVRRHIVAPFDGVLEQSFCQPGDIVTAGQLLGRLDAKELKWELAGVTADRDRAAKSRDINLSSGKTAAAQIDRYDARRFEERRKLLENRLQHLDVKSPIAGVVVSGDLDRAEGAPVKLGGSLYEVAPLDEMVVEVFVPETEVDRICIGQTVAVALDALSINTLSGTVARIFPRAEIRHESNVFVAEVLLANEGGKLRPGMKGRAAVATDRRPLAWVVSHRFVESAYRWIW